MPLLDHLHTEPGLLPDLPAAPVRILVDADGGRVYGLRLEITGTAEDWETIQRRGLFWCAPEVLGPILGGAFSPALPYEFTVALLPEHVLIVAVLAESAAGAHRVLQEASADSVLRSSRSWRLLSVVQPRTPKAKWGLTTTWFEQGLK